MLANSAECKILTTWHATFRLPTKITQQEGVKFCLLPSPHLR